MPLDLINIGLYMNIIKVSLSIPSKDLTLIITDITLLTLTQTAAGGRSAFEACC